MLRRFSIGIFLISIIFNSYPVLAGDVPPIDAAGRKALEKFPVLRTLFAEVQTEPCFVNPSPDAEAALREASTLWKKNTKVDQQKAISLVRQYFNLKDLKEFSRLRQAFNAAGLPPSFLATIVGFSALQIVVEARNGKPVGSAIWDGVYGAAAGAGWGAAFSTTFAKIPILGASAFGIPIVGGALSVLSAAMIGFTLGTAIDQGVQIFSNTMTQRIDNYFAKENLTKANVFDAPFRSYFKNLRYADRFIPLFPKRDDLSLRQQYPDLFLKFVSLWRTELTDPQLSLYQRNSLAGSFFAYSFDPSAKSAIDTYNRPVGTPRLFSSEPLTFQESIEEITIRERPALSRQYFEDSVEVELITLAYTNPSEFEKLASYYHHDVDPKNDRRAFDFLNPLNKNSARWDYMVGDQNGDPTDQDLALLRSIFWRIDDFYIALRSLIQQQTPQEKESVCEICGDTSRLDKLLQDLRISFFKKDR